MQIHKKTQHNTTIWVSDHVHATFRENWFDYQQNSQDSDVNNWESGRQTVSKFSVDGRNLICRHYCRGGLPARITRDKFIFRGLDVSRPIRELELLHIMRELKLPVPEPIAARCIVSGLLYSADIIIGEIADTETLAQVLTRRSLQESEWQKIGEIIHRFHSSDIQHVDLNANNILINKSGDVFLIDFDRCLQKKYAEQWGNSNLNRLRRSLQKFKKANQSFNFSETDFNELLIGYQS